MKIDRLGSIGYIDSSLIEKAGRTPVGKPKTGWIRWCAVAACFAAVVLILRRGNGSCSDEKLQELRKDYPLCYPSGTLSMAPMPELAALSKAAENYVCVTVLDELEDSEVSANAGFGKAGEETFVFRNFRIRVDRVICGDTQLKDRTIVVTINRMLPIPQMKAGDKMILPVSKREDEKYDLGPGAYYIADGYVLSAFEEKEGSVYTGQKVQVLIRDIKKYAK